MPRSQKISTNEFFFKRLINLFECQILIYPRKQISECGSQYSVGTRVSKRSKAKEDLMLATFSNIIDAWIKDPCKLLLKLGWKLALRQRSLEQCFPTSVPRYKRQPWEIGRCAAENVSIVPFSDKTVKMLYQQRALGHSTVHHWTYRSSLVVHECYTPSPPPTGSVPLDFFKQKKCAVTKKGWETLV